MTGVENKNDGPLDTLSDMEKKVRFTSSNPLARCTNKQTEPIEQA
jgi:hypothetical protein